MVAVAEEDDETALGILAFILEGWPNLMWHPHIQWVFQHLASYAGVVPPPQAHLERSQAALKRLIEPWTRGLLGEYPRRGNKLALFPRYWDDTLEGSLERNAAFRFRQLFEDLMDRLKPCPRWKALRNQYRRLTDELKYPHAEKVLATVAAHVAAAWEDFCKKWSVGGDGPPASKLSEIVRAGFEVRTGGDPRYRIACGLFAYLPFEVAGVERRASSATIDSTLRTLRKPWSLRFKERARARRK